MKHRQTGRMLRMHRDRVRDSGGDGGAFGGGEVSSMDNNQTFWGMDYGQFIRLPAWICVGD